MSEALPVRLFGPQKPVWTCACKPRVDEEGNRHCTCTFFDRCETSRWMYVYRYEFSAIESADHLREVLAKHHLDESAVSHAVSALHRFKEKPKSSVSCDCGGPAGHVPGGINCRA